MYSKNIILDLSFVTISTALILVSCQAISEVQANQKPEQIQQEITPTSQSEQPNPDPTKSPDEEPLTYENAPFTIRNPAVLDKYKNGEYDPKSREKLTDPSFEDIRQAVEQGRIVTFQFIEDGEGVYTHWPAGEFVIEALSAIPDENGDYYLGIIHVDTGKVELMTVDTTGVVLVNIVDNWKSYIPYEP